MRPRDRRALLLLGLWGVGLGLWFGGRLWWTRRGELRLRQASLAALKAKDAWLTQHLAEVQGHRRKILETARPEWLGLPEDQLRLRFQDALLAAGQRAGLQEMRLRVFPSVGGAPTWRLEGSGTLVQWMDFLEGVEHGGVPVELHALHWATAGDPWAPQGGEGLEGPGLKGELLWIGVVPPPEAGRL